MKEKKLKISLSTTLLLIALVIIAVMGAYIYKLNTEKANNIQNMASESENKEDESKTSNDINKKSISGRFAFNSPGDSSWYDEGEYLFKDDGTVEHISATTVSGTYTINGNIINIHWTELEGEPLKDSEMQDCEFLIKDDDTLLSLTYDTEDNSSIYYVKGTVFFRQNDK